MTELGTQGRPLRVAIVGSGPSGFFAAEALFKSGTPVTVDVFDRLPTPFGLVRGGVAPDHQKIKKVTKTFEKTAAHDGFAFLGNVTVGRDITVEELRRHYDAVLFACGAETDRRLAIPGEDLPGSHTATEFVGWYNAHPDFVDRTFDLSGEVAFVIGQGNVAVDVCRILCKTVDELRETDISEAALDALAESRLKEIHIIGRRGPVQAKFTSQEIRELGKLADCEPVVDPNELVVDPVSQVELDDDRGAHSRKNLELLHEFSARSPAGKSRRCHIRFFRSPVELRGEGRLESVVLENNELSGEPFHQRAHGMGIEDECGCGILFRSVGYRGVGIPGVPFDEQHGVIPNRDGRVLERSSVAPGLYVTGWIKRGPSGIIGTNKRDSVETVHALLEDLPNVAPCENPDTDAVREVLRSREVRVVSFDDWHRIDEAEVARGEAKGKPREKFRTAEELLAVLDAVG